MLGRTRIVKNMKSNNNIINVGDLSSGMYYVKCETPDKVVYIGRLIKE